MSAPKKEEGRRLDVPDASWSPEAETQRWSEKLGDPEFLHAYELFQAAWRLAESGAGDAASALALMQDAADIDSDYRQQVEYLGSVLERKASSGAGDRLLALEDLRDRNLISDDEFFTKQRDIMSEIS
ncbi:MAG TPA: hypothetical protein VGS07_13020 [Thermoanaerobaculia bacterium]|jgi:hypothetical protein|nr:hypothetical protein [Thermoanaerobaculia bacterium]